MTRYALYERFKVNNDLTGHYPQLYCVSRWMLVSSLFKTYESAERCKEYRSKGMNKNEDRWWYKIVEVEDGNETL